MPESKSYGVENVMLLLRSLCREVYQLSSPDPQVGRDVDEAVCFLNEMDNELKALRECRALKTSKTRGQLEYDRLNRSAVKASGRPLHGSWEQQDTEVRKGWELYASQLPPRKARTAGRFIYDVLVEVGLLSEGNTFYEFQGRCENIADRCGLPATIEE